MTDPTTASRGARDDAVLMLGHWPDPRSGGISSLVHDLIKAINEAGRTVYLLIEGCAAPSELGPDRVQFAAIDGTQPFQWRQTVRRLQSFSDFHALFDADQAGLLEGGRPALERVRVVHYHGDPWVPHYNAWERRQNNYRTIADWIESRSGVRPRIVRTRYDDLPAGLDRLMRLTGIDYVALDRAGKEALLAGDLDLPALVARHVAANRSQLKSTGWTDHELDEAIHHVWYVLHQLRIWRIEQHELDAVVVLTQSEVENVKAYLLPSRSDNLLHIHAGTSFSPESPQRVEGLLYDFHHRAALCCRRGDGERCEPIAFRPKDKKVVFVGRSQRSKGIDELAQSVGRLYHGGGAPVRAIFVGDFDAATRRRLAAYDPKHAHKYLLFAGSVRANDALAALFAFGNVTAIPSHHETFAVVGLESYRMGTPCVVTAGTGAGDAYHAFPLSRGTEMSLPVRKPFHDGPYRFYGVDVDSLADQLGRAVNDDPLAVRLANDGRRFVEQRYSYQQMGCRYLELYDRLGRGENAGSSSGSARPMGISDYSISAGGLKPSSDCHQL